MPLARASRGGWWASAFTGLFPRKCRFDEESMTRFWPAQKASRRAERRQIGAAMLTGQSQQCGMAKTGEAIAVSLEGAMADKSNDPVAIWQNMIGEMEKGFNSFANQAMASPEFSKAMNQAGGVSAGAQRQFAEFMEKYLLSMNLPSRAQMIGMAERLQSIEGQLNEIKAMLGQMNT